MKEWQVILKHAAGKEFNDGFEMAMMKYLARKLIDFQYTVAIITCFKRRFTFILFRSYPKIFNRKRAGRVREKMEE